MILRFPNEKLHIPDHAIEGRIEREGHVHSYSTGWMVWYLTTRERTPALFMGSLSHHCHQCRR